MGEWGVEGRTYSLGSAGPAVGRTDAPPRHGRLPRAPLHIPLARASRSASSTSASVSWPKSAYHSPTAVNGLGR